MRRTAIALVVLAFLAGCASFDGRTLVAGKSTRAEVEATMGKPTEVVPSPNGDTVLYYSRLPYGREMYVVNVGPDGVMRSIEQRLTRKNIARIKPEMTAQQVRELLGPPYRDVYLKVLERNVWEYPWRNVEDRRILWVQFAGGLVQEVYDLHDFESDAPSGYFGPSKN